MAAQVPASRTNQEQKITVFKFFTKNSNEMELDYRLN